MRCPVHEWLEIDRYALVLTHKLQDEICAGYESYEFHLVVQSLQSFCSEQLGGFYLDILKDRLYTAGEDSFARRSAQNALHEIMHSLTCLIAPILSFTAEEVWSTHAGDDAGSIFERLWHVLPASGTDAKFADDWRQVCAIREIANKQIEEQRAQGLLGSSLQAELDIHATGDAYRSLKRLGDDLKYVFITSRVTLHPGNDDNLEVIVSPSAHSKCSRCWHYREDVGIDAQHPALCGRCVSNLFGEGEARKYA